MPGVILLLVAVSAAGYYVSDRSGCVALGERLPLRKRVQEPSSPWPIEDAAERSPVV